MYIDTDARISVSLTVSLRVEMSFFVLSPEIEDRGAVEVDNWAKHKKTLYILNYNVFCKISKWR
jgi:hypothetical protein